MARFRPRTLQEPRALQRRVGSTRTQRVTQTTPSLHSHLSIAFHHERVTPVCACIPRWSSRLCVVGQDGHRCGSIQARQAALLLLHCAGLARFRTILLL